MLGFGFRRCAAIELNGGTHVRAEVLPMPYREQNGHPGPQVEDWFEIHRVRTIENLERENLNPMEEQISVAEMLEALPDGPQLGGTGEESFVEYRDNGGQFTSDAFDKIAIAIGRPASWVRDRAYLARLTKPVQQMLIEGRLPIAHAREIAKLGDPNDQRFLADQAQLNKDGHGGRSLDQIRSWTNECMKSLRIVPWKLEDPFTEFKSNKKVCGACVGCTYNTSTDRNLFEHERAPEDGMCLNKQCLDEKHKITDKRIDKAVASILKQQLPGTPKSAEAVAVDTDSEFIKPTAIANRAKRVMPQPAPKPGQEKKAATPKATEKSYEDRVREADRKFDDAIYKWTSDAARQIEAKANADGKRLMAMLLLDAANLLGNAWGESQIKARIKEIRGAAHTIKALLGPDPDFCKATKELINAENIPMLEELDSPHGQVLLDMIVEAWSIELPPRPNKDDFMPAKPAAEKKAAKPKSKKK